MWCWINQAPPVLVPKNLGNLLETVVNLPAGPLPPNDLIAVEDDAVGIELIPGQREFVAIKLGQLSRRVKLTNIEPFP